MKPGLIETILMTRQQRALQDSGMCLPRTSQTDWRESLIHRGSARGGAKNFNHGQTAIIPTLMKSKFIATESIWSEWLKEDEGKQKGEQQQPEKKKKKKKKGGDARLSVLCKKALPPTTSEMMDISFNFGHKKPTRYISSSRMRIRPGGENGNDSVFTPEEQREVAPVLSLFLLAGIASCNAFLFFFLFFLFFFFGIKASWKPRRNW